MHLVLVLVVDQAQLLVGIGQDVQNERRTVLEVHFRLLAQFYHFVHQLPCLVKRLLVGGELLGAAGVREGALQFGQNRRNVFGLLRASSTRRHFGNNY